MRLVSCLLWQVLPEQNGPGMAHVAHTEIKLDTDPLVEQHG